MLHAEKHFAGKPWCLNRLEKQEGKPSDLKASMQ